MADQGIHVLRIDSSSRHEGSQTRTLTDEFLQTLQAKETINKITTRDVTKGLSFIDQTWIGANFTDDSDRSLDQKTRLEFSDQLVAELEAADLIVIGVPIYNFGIPAALKAWIDLVARARKTFRYTEQGPVGLLDNKQAVIITASGGTAVGSEIDFATPYLKHVLGFLGIHDVKIIKADQLMIDPESAMSAAKDSIREFEANKAA